jgi:hypothetical protein
MMSLIFNFNYEKLIAYKTPNININAPNTYLNEGKIFYKYINNNLVYIISMKKTNLVFTIIHGQNGKIIEEQVIRNVDGKSVKYAFYEEVREYIESGKSVLVYNHRCRKPERKYFEDLEAKLQENLKVYHHMVQEITFPKGTIRDFCAYICCNAERGKMGERNYA